MGNISSGVNCDVSVLNNHSGARLPRLSMISLHARVLPTRVRCARATRSCHSQFPSPCAARLLNFHRQRLDVQSSTLLVDSRGCGCSALLMSASGTSLAALRDTLTHALDAAFWIVKANVHKANPCAWARRMVSSVLPLERVVSMAKLWSFVSVRPTQVSFGQRTSGLG